MKTLRSKYLALGGSTRPVDETKMGLSSAIGLGASLGSGLIDSFGKGNTRVGGALSGGLGLGMQGLKAGGLVGGAVGFGVGAITGLIRSNRQKELQEREDRLVKDQQKQYSLDAGQAAIAGDQSLIYGRRKAEYFANGGTLVDPTKPKSIKTARGNEVSDADLAKTKAATGIGWDSKEAYGEWVDKFAEPVREPSKSTVTYPYGRRGEVMTQDEWDYSRTKRKYPDVYADKRQGTDNFAPGESFANEIKNDIKEYRSKQSLLRPKMADGGTLKQLNESTVEVSGNTHAQGGVQIPGAEVEHGETISKGFVFSDRLGFSKLHKPIAKALGALENKINNPVNAKTKELLEKKEQALALQQEYHKQQSGLPSDLDNV